MKAIVGVNTARTVCRTVWREFVLFFLFFLNVCLPSVVCRTYIICNSIKQMGNTLRNDIERLTTGTTLLIKMQ